MIIKNALTTIVVSLSLAVYRITGQDQSQPTVTFNPDASPSSSSPPEYTPIVSNHTNPNYNPANGDAGFGVNNSYSPPFPWESTRGSGNWEYAINRAREWITQYNLTLEEKVALTTGVGWQGKGFGNRSCVGNIPPLERAGFRGLCLQDSPAGVRFTDGVTVFPAGINVASTFDRDLMYRRGYSMGQEFKAKGVNVALGPGMNMLRVPNAGRNWEMGGADPYLAGELSYNTIRGMQDGGVQACAKHYIFNEQERNRTTSSSNVDDYTAHMHYLPPFLKAVQADVASVMCSYNLINSSWACQNALTQNGYLKHELGFNGYILSDWAATESGVSSVLSGLDMTMPGDIQFGSNTSYFGANLTEAVRNGSVPESRVDDMATRILGGYFLLGQDDPAYPNVSFDSFDRYGATVNDFMDVREDHSYIARRVAEGSTVLLKNVNGTLPLQSPKRMAVIGSAGGPALRGPNGISDRGGLDGSLGIGWGSGTADYTYYRFPIANMQEEAISRNIQFDWYLLDWDLNGVRSVASAAQDVVVVFVASDSGEEYITVDGNVGDRNNLTAWNQGDEVILAAANVSENVVVVVNSVGAIDMERWIENPNVKAVVYTGLPASEAGTAITEILWGRYNPSGRLPFTIARNVSDYGTEIVFVNTDEDPQPQVDYTEGIYVDYAHFLQYNITPRYGFGYGMSYTSFNHTNLQVQALDTWCSNEYAETYSTDQAYNQTGSSLSESLHRPRYQVSVDVQNVGGVYGCDIPQLYLGFPSSVDQPPKVLKGFERVTLDVWQAQRVEFNLSFYDLSVWNVTAQVWSLPRDDFTIYVGESAFDENAISMLLPVTMLPSEEEDIYAC